MPGQRSQRRARRAHRDCRRAGASRTVAHSMRPRSLVALCLPFLLPAAATGCAALGYPTGSIYTGTETPHGMQRMQGAGANKAGTARGEACATGILGLVAFGDASLAAAKKAIPG